MSNLHSFMLSRQLLQKTVTKSHVRLKATANSDLVLSSTKNNVTTITLNDPGKVPVTKHSTKVLSIVAKYNAWSKSLSQQMIAHFERAADDAETKVRRLECIHILYNSYYTSRLSSILGQTHTSVLEEAWRNSFLASRL